jgi:hypothetical protein
MLVTHIEAASSEKPNDRYVSTDSTHRECGVTKVNLALFRLSIFFDVCDMNRGNRVDLVFFMFSMRVTRIEAASSEKPNDRYVSTDSTHRECGVTRVNFSLFKLSIFFDMCDTNRGDRVDSSF